MASAKVYRLGVLGVGEGRSILHAAQRSARWATTCICDLDEALCRQRMNEHRVEHFTTRYDEMLADPRIDVIAIYTPDPLHADHCLQALRAGKHVLCTKPLVDDLTRGPELLQAVAASGRHLLVGMSCRFFPTFQEQRERFLGGEYGDLLGIEAHYHGDKRRGTSGRWGKARANNWIYTGLVHPVDLVYWYAGLPRTVFGVGQVSPAMQARGYAVADNFHFVLTSRQGHPLAVSGFFGAPSSHPEAEGAIGCVVRANRGCLDARFPAFTLYGHHEKTGSWKVTRSELHPYYYPWGGSMHHAGEFQNYLEHFASCLDCGEKPCPDAVDGLRVVAVLRAMEQSLREGSPVEVERVLAAAGLAALAADP